MKKLTLISLISALSCNTLVHAGGMGDYGQCNSAPFISLEGGYTTHTIDDYDYTITGLGLRLTSIKTSQHYTGRLGAGMLSMIDDRFGMTGELGWGYYGRTKLTPQLVSLGDFTIQDTITGFDALVGFAWVQPNFGFSLKAGALIQNVTTETTLAIPTFTVPGFPPLVNSFTSKVNRTAALPEVKIGGSYNFDSNWSLTAAYMVALGSNPRTSGDINATTGALTFNTNTLNPTIHSFLLGVQYTFY
jgi:hypothetical protein